MTYIEAQNEVIRKYRVTISDGKGCWRRMHAHVKERKVCKWKPKSSIQATFDLFHEIGHIETTKSSMRRAEKEYYATVWAIERCKEFGFDIPQSIIDVYQNYIDREIRRGLRRGGSNYGQLKLQRSL